MTALNLRPHPGDRAPTSIDECRDRQLEYIYERLEAIRRRAIVGQDFVELRDEAGLRHALKHMVKDLSEACATFKQAPEPREAA